MLNSLLQNINDGAKLYDTEKQAEIGKIADFSTKEMEEQEQMSKSIRNNINSTKENMKKSAEELSKNIEKWKIIKDKISKSNELLNNIIFIN